MNKSQIMIMILQRKKIKNKNILKISHLKEKIVVIRAVEMTVKSLVVIQQIIIIKIKVVIQIVRMTVISRVLNHQMVIIKNRMRVKQYKVVILIIQMIATMINRINLIQIIKVIKYMKKYQNQTRYYTTMNNQC